MEGELDPAGDDAAAVGPLNPLDPLDPTAPEEPCPNAGPTIATVAYSDPAASAMTPTAMASDPNRRERLRRGRRYIDRVYRPVDARALVAVTLCGAREHRGAASS